MQDSDDPSVDHRIWERELIDATSDAELEHRVILGEIDLTLGQFDNLRLVIFGYEEVRLSEDFSWRHTLFEAEI